MLGASGHASAQRVLQDKVPERLFPSGCAVAYTPAGQVEDADTSATTVGDVTGTRYYTFGGATVAVRAHDGNVALVLGESQGSVSVTMPVTLNPDGTMASATIADAQAVTRTSYTPYGQLRGADNLALDRGWLGQVEDRADATTGTGTGLTYLNARYYDPVLARFVSPDPLRDLLNPATFDSYAYGFNNPVVFMDPMGLFGWGDVGNWIVDHKEALIAAAVVIVIAAVIVATAGTAAPVFAVVASAGATMAAGEAVVVGASVATTVITTAGLAATAAATTHVAVNTQGDALDKAEAAYPVALTGVMMTGGAAATASFLVPAKVPTSASSSTSSRAKELQAQLPEATKGRVTMAAADVATPSGQVVRVVASSEPGDYLRRTVAPLPDEIVVHGQGHAEQKIIDFARTIQGKVLSIDAGRPLCSVCAAAVQKASAATATPVRPVPSKTTTGRTAV